VALGSRGLSAPSRRPIDWPRRVAYASAGTWPGSSCSLRDRCSVFAVWPWGTRALSTPLALSAVARATGVARPDTEQLTVRGLTTWFARTWAAGHRYGEPACRPPPKSKKRLPKKGGASQPPPREVEIGGGGDVPVPPRCPGRDSGLSPARGRGDVDNRHRHPRNTDGGGGD